MGPQHSENSNCDSYANLYVLRSPDLRKERFTAAGTAETILFAWLHTAHC